MAIQYSTALRNFLNNYGSLKEAITGGKMVLYQGTTPTDPDGAISGTALVTVTQASAARTAAIPARGSITFAGTIAVGDHLETLTVDAVSIISGVITSTGTSNTDFATAVAADINAYQGPGRRVKAWSSAGVVYLEASPQAGAVTWTVSHTIHDLADANWTVTNEDFGTTRTGVPWASGLLLYEPIHARHRTNGGVERFVLDEQDAVVRLLSAHKPFVASADPVLGHQRDLLQSRKASWFFPLWISGSLEGIAGLGNSALRGSDIRMIGALCTKTALTIENLRLHTELSRKFERFSATVELAKTLTPVRSYEALFQSFMFKSAELLRAERGSLMILDRETNALLLEAQKGIIEGRRLRETPARRSVKSRN